VKLDTLGPYTFGVIFAVLLGMRVWWAARKG
jgi:DMSO/TMAO reductase YedYZ heme-binding membrane subunit